MNSISDENYDNYTLARYEDLVFEPRHMAGHLRKFADVPQDESMDNWIKKLEEGEEAKYRNSFLTSKKFPKESVAQWKRKLSFAAIQRLQACCADYMKHFGYENVTEIELKNTSVLGFQPMAHN